MNTSGKSSDNVAEESDDFKQKFRQLPLNKKLTTLMELEAATASEAVNTIINKSISAGESVMDMFTGKASDDDEK